MVDGLRHATRLDEYWTNDFLKKAIRRVPDSVIELAKTRIEGAIASGDWGMQPLGGVLGGGDALDLLSLPEGREILRGLLDWARGRIG
ncbi:hypothetical protein, partial [Enterococcus faecium]|uniref:hypothetical protein n=1 Tax=Enterococcus faecium TaxID=1352 RepID=UPI0034E94E88